MSEERQNAIRKRFNKVCKANTGTGKRFRFKSALAEHLGIKRQHLNGILTETAHPTAIQVALLCEATQTSCDFVLLGRL